MPSTFDDLMQEARDAGVDDAWLERVQAATAASPLRKERDELKAALQEATEKATKFGAAALNAQFAALGIKVKPDALRLPDDLDPLDTEKVREWAVGMGLADPPPPAVPPEEQAAHQRLAEAAAAGGVAPPATAARDEIMSATSADEFWAKARAAGQVID